MERVSREEWAKRVERWKDSGLTAAEYAAETGINAHSLSWWRWQLGSASKSASPAQRRARRPRVAATKTATPLTFVELTAPPIAEPLEVVLASSIRVRVPASFDAAALGRLLDVLEQRR
jgi:hypothetical protein